jgi:hypothetical protein
MSDAAALEERIRQLEAENAALRAERPQPAPSTPAEARTPRRSGWWRALLSAVCITLAAILVPVSVIGGWTRAQLVDEQSFVDTFAPLAQDPRVQDLVIAKATEAIDASVDIDGFTNDLFDGLSGLDLPPRAIDALDLLRAPAAAGVRSLVDSAVTTVVQSDAFAQIWERALTLSHRTLVATVTNSGDGVVTIDGQGVIGIQLGPIIDELKTALEAQGFGFASAIPTIDATIVVAQSDSLLLVEAVYNLAATVGYWLPFLSIALFALGILIARRRSVASLGSGVGIALGAGFLASALTGASVVLGLNAPSLGIPSATLDTIFFTVVGAMRDTALVLAFVGVVFAIAAWLGGRSRAAARVRAFSGSLTGSARRGLQRRGLATGRFGQWIYQQRLLVRLVLLVLTIVVLFFLRPLNFGTAVAVILVALLVWLVLELLSRHPGDAEPPADPADVDDLDVTVVEETVIEETVVVTRPAPRGRA